MEMRKNVFCIESCISIDEEFDETQEKACQHLVCYGKFLLLYCYLVQGIKNIDDNLNSLKYFLIIRNISFLFW
jgi:hypothetical protein